jgi:hypothetical protein
LTSSPQLSEVECDSRDIAHEPEWYSRYKTPVTWASIEKSINCTLDIYHGTATHTYIVSSVFRMYGRDADADAIEKKGIAIFEQREAKIRNDKKIASSKRTASEMVPETVRLLNEYALKVEAIEKQPIVQNAEELYTDEELDELDCQMADMKMDPRFEAWMDREVPLDYFIDAPGFHGGDDVRTALLCYKMACSDVGRLGQLFVKEGHLALDCLFACYHRYNESVDTSE